MNADGLAWSASWIAMAVYLDARRGLILSHVLSTVFTCSGAILSLSAVRDGRSPEHLPGPSASYAA